MQFAKEATIDACMRPILDSLALGCSPLSNISTAQSTPEAKSPLMTDPSIPIICSPLQKESPIPATSPVNTLSIEQVLLDAFSAIPNLPATAVNELFPPLPELSPVPSVPVISKSLPSPHQSTCATYSPISKEPISPRTALKRMSKLRRQSPTSSPPKKKNSRLGHNSAKTEFLALVEELKIVNGQEYEAALVKSHKLRTLEKTIQSSTLEALKKIQFRQNFLLSRKGKSLKSAIVLPQSPMLLKSLRGGWHKFLDHIAPPNGLTRQSLKCALGRWLLNKEQKRKGLILIGASDSGKTFFGDCLLSCFRPCEIGYFQCPMSTNVSVFMYANLINKLVYRCDEFFLEQLGVLQSFKQLTEGSTTLQTEIKYKDAINVDPRPVLVTMNGNDRQDVVKYHSGEWEAVNNRCIILKMDKPLKSCFSGNQLDALRKGAHVLIDLLLENTDNTDINGAGIEEFMDYV